MNTVDPKQQQIDEYEKLVKDELDILSNSLLKKVSNQDIYLRHLKLRYQFIKWTNTKHRLRIKGTSPDHVYKRDIFYCNLGVNVGSEQELLRPVIILQNDRGNQSSPTTIVAPITTHKNSQIILENNQTFIEFTNDEGNTVRKRLDYYEVPVYLESGWKEEIKGYINLAQIRTIDKKRLHSTFVARITTGTEQSISTALDRLLKLF